MKVTKFKLGTFLNNIYNSQLHRNVIPTRKELKTYQEQSDQCQQHRLGNVIFKGESIDKVIQQGLISMKDDGFMMTQALKEFDRSLSLGRR